MFSFCPSRTLLFRSVSLSLLNARTIFFSSMCGDRTFFLFFKIQTKRKYMEYGIVVTYALLGLVLSFCIFCLLKLRFWCLFSIFCLLSASKWRIVMIAFHSFFVLHLFWYALVACMFLCLYAIQLSQAFSLCLNNDFAYQSAMCYGRSDMDCNEDGVERI